MLRAAAAIVSDTKAVASIKRPTSCSNRNFTVANRNSYCVSNYKSIFNIIKFMKV
jgi:hypothetical protein